MTLTEADIARIICEHFPKVPDGCAPICMDRLGSIPKEGCIHRLKVHGKCAKAILRMDRGRRTGSYPLMYIAQDYGVPYAVVLCYADRIAALVTQLGKDMEGGESGPLPTTERINEIAGYWGCWALEQANALISDKADGHGVSQRLQFHFDVYVAVVWKG